MRGQLSSMTARPARPLTPAGPMRPAAMRPTTTDSPPSAIARAGTEQLCAAAAPRSRPPLSRKVFVKGRPAKNDREAAKEKSAERRTALA